MTSPTPDTTPDTTPDAAHRLARKQRPSPLGVLLIIAALLLVVASSPPATRWMHRARYEGAPAPAIALPELRLDAPTVRLDAFKGKVVLLDFWATWCPPCRKQMPTLERLSRDPALSDILQVISINTDEQEPDRQTRVRAFLRANHYTMTTLLDDGSAQLAYRVQSIPTLIVIGPRGDVINLLHGVHSEAQLREVIAQAIH